MVTKKARKDEIEAAAPRKPATRKRTKRRQATSPAASGAAVMCDDIIRNIFARLPARTLVASMMLSKHHCRMILSPEFSSLHCRLGPPLPHPQTAYIVTVAIAHKCGGYIVSGFHQFHVADAGRLGCDAPMRSLTGTKHMQRRPAVCSLEEVRALEPVRCQQREGSDHPCHRERRRGLCLGMGLWHEKPNLQAASSAKV
ncbi:hypothetical protein PR202_gb10476 [Eleusine coracana subsp. coracana]|uniref:F-box domain-containing protein n=1 Tax=Eleusine coracana subsp. coracana TaxID=191504 RepID=A0AAV5EK33_ELECO|nr:hypothetical protein PR202_gb10476 [Eleusine coracana subsp. coracana]